MLAGSTLPARLLDMRCLPRRAPPPLQFDFGPETVGTLVGNLTDLGIPVLACNIDASAEPSLAGMLEPFTLIRLPKSNVTVGVVGLTTPDTAYTSQPGGWVGVGSQSTMPLWLPAAACRASTPTQPQGPPPTPPRCAGPNIRFLPPNETLPECVAAARKAGAEVWLRLAAAPSNPCHQPLCCLPARHEAPPLPSALPPFLRPPPCRRCSASLR